MQDFDFWPNLIEFNQIYPIYPNLPNLKKFARGCGRMRIELRSPNAEHKFFLAIGAW